ncbi:MAG TPA: ATP-binding cassette domain-containing protein, partial [Candidatus Aminicenantes bacterium]|nr:ATP-binding cassette domain-containing protein [Candidatus Aminicenantes bacterium]
MALVSLQDVCLAFGGAPLLDHATMQIERGERICLLGRNGCGKTTLLKLIHGDLLPDQGAVARSPGLTSARLDQEIPSDIAGTVLEVVTSGLGARGQLLADYRRTGAMLAESGGTDPQWLARLDRLSQALDVDRGWEIHRRVEDIVARLGLPADHAFASLSTGQRRRTLLARALVAEPDVLLLDEPTNHLDIDSIAWLEDFLTTTRSTVILVTHDRALVRKVADRIIELDRGRLIDGRCGYDTFLERKEQEMAAERERDGRLDRRLAIEEAWLRRGVKARRTRDEGRVKALLRMRQQRLARREQAGRLNLTIQSGGRTGTLVMEAERIAFSFGERPVVTDFSCQVLRGDRVGIVGANGCGKTTLLRLLLGELQPQRGQVRLGTNLEVIYFDQLRQQLDEEKSVFESFHTEEVDDVYLRAAASYGSTMKLVRRAAKLKNPCDWGIDLADGAETLLPHLAKAKAVAIATRFRAKAFLHQGKENEAVEDIVSAFCLARRAPQDDTLISVLVQIAAEGILTATVAENFGAFSPEALKKIQDGIDACPPRTTVANAIFKGERCF